MAKDYRKLSLMLRRLDVTYRIVKNDSRVGGYSVYKDSQLLKGDMPYKDLEMFVFGIWSIEHDGCFGLFLSEL